MKKFKKRIFCIFFLCMMAGTLTVYADDRDVDSGAGISFEGSIEATETPQTTGTPGGTGKTGGSGTTTGSKSSLPQTGQETNMLLPATGCMMLILIGWCFVEKNRKRNGVTTGGIIRKEQVPY